MDNDFGEHWFDNFEERQAKEIEAAKLGLDSEELLVVVPDRFKDGRDGPVTRPSFENAFGWMH